MASGKVILGLGLGALALLIFGRGKGSSVSTTPTAPAPRNDVRLSPHFWQSEFLRSRTVPAVARYKPTEVETTMLRRWAVKVGEPLRALFGPVMVTGGARPDSVRDPQGRSFTEALRAAGYKPSDSSDHRWFGAADVQFPNLPASEYQRAFQAAKDNPDVRQVILEINEGKPTLHVAVVAPGKPAIEGAKRAFMIVDNEPVRIS